MFDFQSSNLTMIATYSKSNFKANFLHIKYINCNKLTSDLILVGVGD